MFLTKSAYAVVSVSSGLLLVFGTMMAMMLPKIAVGDSLVKTDQKSAVLMIIAPKDFRDEELFVPKKLFEDGGMAVTVASTVMSTAVGMLKGTVKPDVLVGDVDVSKFDAVVFVGGVGAKVYYEDKVVHKIARDAVNAGKVVAAICLAPNILAKAGLLEGRKATCWDREILTLKGAKYHESDVVRDGKIITASGPQAARKFAEAILRAIAENRVDK